LLMTYVWLALEDAGYTSKTIAGTNTGIFVGTANTGYESLLLKSQIDSYTSMAMVPSMGPNRMSYFLDIHGPSEPIETACSSSLIAIHRAVISMHAGICDMAIAGGINSLITPDIHICFNKTGMLSGDGRCKTFSKNANGYVRGEGVGMLLLKKLKQAEQDKDHIYGVIIGSAENHGGKANSLTAPNPRAQAELIKTAYRKAGIDPGTISYIEAHGTGTELGDPIEINGLKTAFREMHEDPGIKQKEEAYCGLGSVKTNIGHLELAAGIAGVIKVLLQLKHKTLVKSLHCEEINPYIELKGSPFYILQEEKEWDSKRNEENKIIPRRAGISSFGFGGVNAHVVIEEYIPEQNAALNSTIINSNNPAILVLSARSREQVKEQANNLIAYLEENKNKDLDLGNIAYTLQVGREAMEERFGLIVSSPDELKEKLKAYLAGGENIKDLFTGHIKKNRETLEVFKDDDDLQKTVHTWMEKRKYGKLAGLWVKGLELDWNLLYGEEKPARVSLPAYPFAREKYWITNNADPGNENTGIKKLHPLLHENTSTLEEQKFTSEFGVEEFFLQDDIITGQKILPGVVFLEMARAAIEKAVVKDYEGMVLENIVWDSSLSISDKLSKITISLYPGGNGQISYEIYGEEDEVLYNRGTGKIIKCLEAERIDIDALRRQCDKGEITKKEYYEAYEKMGIICRAEHRAVQQLYKGENQVLARLELPAVIQADKLSYILHPSIMTGALQVPIGLMIETDSPDSSKPVLPYALDRMEVISGCREKMWVIVRYQKGCGAGNKIQKLDMDLCDEHGIKCVKMKGLSFRTNESNMVSGQKARSTGTIFMESVWYEKEIALSELQAYEKRLIILCEINKPDKVDTAVSYIRLDSKEQQISKRYETYAVRVFEELKKILGANPGGRVLIQLLVENKQEKEIYRGLSGLLKTAKLENPKLKVQVIGINESDDIAETVEENGKQPEDEDIRYVENKKRHVLGLKEIANKEKKCDIPWKEDGVYIITGGAGSLGLIIAKEVGERIKRATLLLAGRSKITEAQRKRIKALTSPGCNVEYLEADVTNIKEIRKLIRTTLKKYGKINGIIHGAGIIRDNLILKKSKEEFLQVLAPKVTGLVNIDETTKNVNMDFILIFSSLSGVSGNMGQADYAAANAFMDRYAEYRNWLVKQGKRNGKTISIQWPLWEDGGMKIDEATKKVINEKWGIIPLKTENGIEALYVSFGLDKTRVIVVEGFIHKIHKLFLKNERNDDPGYVESKTGKQKKYELRGLSVEDSLEWDLKDIISKILQINKNKLDLYANLAEIGFDSIGLTELARVLSTYYGVEITPSIFFGYSTIAKLKNYFLEEQKKIIESFYHKQEEIPGEVIKDDVQVKMSPKRTHSIEKFRIGYRDKMPGIFQADQEPIAIIGISGKFPRAQNVDELWKILEAGEEVIEEIPEERWDWEKYYGDPLKERNKTNCKWSGFIPGVKEFDPLFFEISPKEAEVMDPRQRQILQESWKALEDAGYGSGDVQKRKIGMFIGVEEGGFQAFNSDNIGITSIHNAILAARLSYFLNLSGPNMAINTACSSGLVAVHQAILSLRNEECDTALAGGVNLLLSPGIYIIMARAGMLSSDGKCYAFSKKANGLVPSEAVAVVVLKRLSRAEKDGDHIYAVIKGSGINYDGKTNGITSPNGLAQSNLLKSVYNKYEINPGDISYIVTHGTGTILGDPVEINALDKTFKEYTDKNKYCAISSTKTNFGHSLAASGLVSLISLVQALKHKKIPASLNCEEENDYIHWETSPFYVNKALKKWESDNDKARIGAVSSFGMSGTNVHVVVEEYKAGSHEGINRVYPPYYLIVLSAKTEKSLADKIQEMISLFRNNQFTTEELLRLSYTLITGRQHFRYRVSLVIQDPEDCLYTLEKYQNQEGLPNIFSGKVFSDFKGQKAIEKYGQELISHIHKEKEKKSKYQEILFALADFYCQGYELDWYNLYEAPAPVKMSLPTYPFEKTDYWFDEETDASGINYKNEIETKLKPFIGKNISTLSQIQFSTRLNADEICLKYHRLNEKMVLQGTAFIEMAMEAVSLAEKTRNWKIIKNLRWVNPLIMEQPNIDIYINLNTTSENSILFESFSEINGEKKVYAVCEIDSHKDNSPQNRYKINDIISRSSQILDGKQCYAKLSEAGLQIGKPLQALKQVWTNETEAVGMVEISEELKNMHGTYSINPALLDACFSSAVTLLGGKEYFSETQGNKLSGGSSIYLPYVLEKLIMYKAMPENFYVYSRPAESLNTMNDTLVFNIRIVANDGSVIAEIERFTLARYRLKKQLNHYQSSSFLKIFSPEWRKSGESFDENDQCELKGNTIIFDTDETFFNVVKSKCTPDSSSGLLLVKPGEEFRKTGEFIFETRPGEPGDFGKLVVELSNNNYTVDNIIYLWPVKIDSDLKDSIEPGINISYRTILCLCQSLIKIHTTKIKILYLYQNKGSDLQALDQAMTAFSMSLVQEHPGYLMNTICLTDRDNVIPADNLLLSIINHEWKKMQTGKEVRYINGIRFEKYFKEIDFLTQNNPHEHKSEKIDLRSQGVYVITGGMRGCGFIIAEYLAGKVNANLIINGRSDLSREDKEKMRKIESGGSKVIYVKGDCSLPADMKQMVNKAHENFGPVNGVIHCAGILNDAFIIKKDLADSEKVFIPKIYGTINLDKVFQAEKLDFFMMFSSLTSIVGNIGQIDYGYANGFIDAFTEYREILRTAGKRSGKTISVNWPFWKDGGMSTTDINIELTKQKLGIMPLENRDAITAFHEILHNSVTRAIVFPFIEESGKLPDTLTGGLPGSKAETKILPNEDNGIKNTHTPADESLKMKAKHYFKNLIAGKMKIPLERLNSKDPFGNYGIDSILITSINVELEKNFPGISKTLFFEYKNLEELVKYFIDNHTPALKKMFENNTDTVEAGYFEIKADSVTSVPQDPPANTITTTIEDNEYTLEKSKKKVEDIAIIGLNGRYPQADNPDEYWSNILQGKDCIIEVPDDRWDHKVIFDPDKNNKKKTYSKWGGFINRADEFDPGFFKISPRDAELIDPQERIFLECVYHTLEDSGYTAGSLKTNRIGVYVGVMYGHYQLYSIVGPSMYHVKPVSSSYASIANRVSYFFNFQGPSMAVDTMCSSSITSMHLACESIKNGECDLAIAGGVNLSLHPAKYIGLSFSRFVSSDGRCRSFGEGGDGYVPGEGVGAVLLKPLSKAIHDNDNIYGIIKGSSLNHCGHTNGYTVPDPLLQGSLIDDALKRASVDPECISYIEAHGTGTSLGDPIEINGLNRAFQSSKGLQKGSIPIGSVKSNIGHLESAAGIAGITKVLLMMKYKKIPPSLHSENLNPNINFKDSYFYVNQEITEWEQKEVPDNSVYRKYPRTAGVSSFGAGGSNAHIILQEYEKNHMSPHQHDDKTSLVILSAMSAEQLMEKTKALIEYIKNKKNEPVVSLVDIAYTLQVGREPMKYRLACLSDTKEELVEILGGYLEKRGFQEKLFVRENNQPYDSAYNDPDESIISAINRHDYKVLAPAWIAGKNIPWEKLYTGKKPLHVSLPLYPFKKKRYWFDSYQQKTTDQNINKEFVMKASDHINDSSKKALYGEFEKQVENYRGDEVICSVIDNSIFLITMQDKANKNMFTANLIIGLVSAFQKIKKDGNIKAAIITGYDNVFCMGGTEESLVAISEKKAQFTDIPFLYKGFLESDIPVISAIQGHAFGGGLLFGLYADIIVMAEDGLYGSNFMNFGFTPGMGATLILKEKLGGIATEMMFTGKTYNGAEIKNRGGSSLLFTQKDNVVKEAINVARMLAKKPAIALKTLKKELSGRILKDMDNIITREQMMHQQTFLNDGVKQKIEKYFKR
ncbi:MAG: SDR family NAD(P)-dependent oxidoreductase, partial [Spirochaetales bacterium]|nr:SDR family NAD(P)-dependent oxidoreductase [Spirochaetales bacterium]